MKERILIERNDKAKINHTALKKLNKNIEANSCNSCGICHRLRSPHISSEGLNLALSQAKSLGKESCAMSFMQKNYGNNFTASLLSQSSLGNHEPAISNKPLAISRKCSCGGSCPGCKAEEEAERVSVSIMKMEKRSQAFKSPSGQLLNLSSSDLVGNSASINNEQAQIGEIMSKKGSGQRLDDNTRSFMENRFGYDFNHVRLHTDSYASKKSNELNAEAFTIGRDIFFNAGRYSPTTTQGKKLLAHELTHVVQQSGFTNINMTRIQLQGDGGGSVSEDYRFTAEGVSVVVRRSCSPSDFGFATAEMATRDALDKIFNTDCIEESRRSRIQRNLIRHGLDIRCRRSAVIGGACAEATGYSIPANIMTIGSRSFPTHPDSSPGCQPLASTILHEIVHLTRGVYSEGLPASCEASCYGAGSGTPDLCRDINVFGRRVTTT